jgi:hypothetical protein
MDQAPFAEKRIHSVAVYSSKVSISFSFQVPERLADSPRARLSALRERFVS